MNEQQIPVGISGFALYVPPFRVALEQWCEWTERPWSKISKVVGRSFRHAGPHESIYTMAANAVLRLIGNYRIDPRDVGFLGFGTESSTDNAAGAVIIKGMVDRALDELGGQRLPRNCEVPELKHACLGGIYAMKGALRYLAADGRGRKAIVVTGDIAEYERGSTGEQTQGAGCVAMLLEENPTLCTIDLRQSGSSSDYRGLDFRKPVARHAVENYTPNVARQHDFPVFNGRYSTYCYLDAVSHAAGDLCARLGQSPLEVYQQARAILFHRPYHWMPIQAMAHLYVSALAHSEAGRDELATLCEAAGVEPDAALVELRVSEDLFARALERGVDADPYPNVSRVAKVARKSEAFETLRRDKMTLGADQMMDLGNLYAAALPAWIASAFEDALDNDVDLAGESLVVFGYGSGDAAEAIPVRVVDDWRDAAGKIGFAKALADCVDLKRHQYEALHDGRRLDDLVYEPAGEFIVERVGEAVAREFQDVGIEYYRWVSPHSGA